MASHDDYTASESPLKKSKTKDSFHGEGPGSKPKIAGSFVAEQDKDKKEETDGNMASEDEDQSEEDNDREDSESGSWSYDSENEKHVRLLDEYDKQIKTSDWFDFEPLPGRPRILGLAYPVKLHRDDMFSNGCKEALKYAIEKENEKGANLFLEGIEHANMHPPNMFYITFKTRNASTTEVKIYQTVSFAVRLTLLKLKFSFSG